MSTIPDRFTIRHATGRYPVLVGGGLLRRLPDLLADLLPGRDLALITDDRVAAASAGWLPVSPWRERFVFPAGEASKTVATWAALSDRMLEAGFGRQSAVLALGGGVTGDLAGFVAATYMRGIPLVQLPVSLVAMVDASLGGKVGVNTPRGKNLLGAFHPPVLVLADTDALATLPDEGYRAGLAETVKHGLMADRPYFEWLEREAPALRSRDPGAVQELVRRSVAIKAAIVSADERESGQRAILNAGHTVGHALEQAAGWSLTHGEAVAMGLVVEAWIARRAGLAPQELDQRVTCLLEELGLPVRLPASVRLGALLDAMGSDKKAVKGEIRFALPAGVGETHQGAQGWTTAVDRQLIVEALTVHGVNVST